MIPTYDIGDLVRVPAEFTNAAGTSIDPSVVKLTVKKPGVAATIYTYGTDPEIVKDAVGEYHADVSVTAHPGFWHCRWWSTGTGQAAEEYKFKVRTLNAQ